ADVQRVSEERLIVGSAIHHDRQGEMRRHTGTRRIERELADRNTHTVGAEGAEAQNALPAGNYYEAHIPLRPVTESLAHSALALDRKIKPLRTRDDMAKLQAGFAYSRRVDQRQKAGGVRHHQPVEERLVDVLQCGKMNVLFEIRRFLRQLHQDSLAPNIFGLDMFGHEADESQCLALGFGESGQLVEMWITQKGRAAQLRRHQSPVPQKLGPVISENSICMTEPLESGTLAPDGRMAEGAGVPAALAF